MGKIQDGDEYLVCRKWQRRTETAYVECVGRDSTFYLFAEDVRINFQKHTRIIPVERARRLESAHNPASIKLAEDELETLKNRVYMCARDGGEAE